MRVTEVHCSNGMGLVAILLPQTRRNKPEDAGTRVGAFAQTWELQAGFRAHCIRSAVTLSKPIAGELTTLGSTHTNFSLLFSFHFHIS